MHAWELELSHCNFVNYIFPRLPKETFCAISKKYILKKGKTKSKKKNSIQDNAVVDVDDLILIKYQRLKYKFLKKW